MSNSPPASSSRALAAALYRAGFEGAAPFPRTYHAVTQWIATHAAALASAPSVPARRARTHIIAIGKAAAAMAGGAAHALREHHVGLAHGVVVTSHTPLPAELAPLDALPEQLQLFVGDHPIPGPGSLIAADAIQLAVDRVEPGDAVLVLLSGGTTALAGAPTAVLAQMVGDVARAQAYIANLVQTLLESGLAIHEMNAIRRRVLRWGAGRLAVALHQRAPAHIAVFAISDVIGDAPEVVGSGPCSPEPWDDTMLYALLDAHNLRASLQRDMAQFLGIQGGESAPAVPPASHPAFSAVTYEFVARNRDALEALANAARSAGTHHVAIDEASLQGDASALGEILAERALVMAATLAAGVRAVWTAGGEPVVHLRQMVDRAITEDDADGTPDEPLKGGRMQSLALAAALYLEAAPDREAAARVTILAAGTDGRDGPTDAAGAIVNSSTARRARVFGSRRPERDLATGRSWFSLDGADDLIRSGPTGTNVMDVVALVIDGPD